MLLLFLFFLSLLLKMFTGNKKDTREQGKVDKRKGAHPNLTGIKKDTREQKMRVLWWLFCEDQKSLRKG